MKTLPVLLKDGYKVGHKFQYPSDTEEVYSNLTPRNTRRTDGNTHVVVFAIQFFVEDYLIRQFHDNFFSRPREEVVEQYDRRIRNYLGKKIDVSHIGELHDLGYLPLKIKALKEGSLVPYGVPCLTIKNTHPRFFWLTNMLETIMSSVLWKPSTSATTALGYRRVFEEFAHLTGAPLDFVPWQGHDFSMRGMSGDMDAASSGAGHLLPFTGTDTLPSIDFLEEYYGADCEKELIGGSVDATEHSVMCAGEPAGELETFKRLLTEVSPTGILSVVSDTWDLWRVATEYLPALKNVILTRPGKLVIRPDSGTPERILCGDPDAPVGSPARSGLVEILWKTFGGTKTSKGYRVLDEHIGTIYGDGISPARQRAILQGLADKNFASNNVVLGLGSYTYQFVTRDTDGWAMKATSVVKGGKRVALFKDPITDNGWKKSAKGLLRVDRVDGQYVLRQDVTPEEEEGGELETVFEDGKIKRRQTLSEIRGVLREQARLS